MRISDWSSDVCSSDLYAGYVLSYALLQAMQSWCVAHPLGCDWLASSPQLFGRAAIAISVVLACLFADCFMQLKRYAPGWRRAVLALAIAVTVAAALRFIPGDALDRISLVLINPLLMLGGPLLLLVAFVAAWRGSRYAWFFLIGWLPRSEEHTSELQSLMRISYAVFCLK